MIGAELSPVAIASAGRRRGRGHARARDRRLRHRLPEPGPGRRRAAAALRVERPVAGAVVAPRQPGRPEPRADVHAHDRAQQVHRTRATVGFSNVLAKMQVPVSRRLALQLDTGLSLDTWAFATLGPAPSPVRRRWPRHLVRQRRVRPGDGRRQVDVRLQRDRAVRRRRRRRTGRRCRSVSNTASERRSAFGAEVERDRQRRRLRQRDRRAVDRLHRARLEGLVARACARQRRSRPRCRRAGARAAAARCRRKTVGVLVRANARLHGSRRRRVPARGPRSRAAAAPAPAGCSSWVPLRVHAAPSRPIRTKPKKLSEEKTEDPIGASRRRRRWLRPLCRSRSCKWHEPPREIVTRPSDPCSRSPPCPRSSRTGPCSQVKTTYEVSFVTYTLPASPVGATAVTVRHPENPASAPTSMLAAMNRFIVSSLSLTV